MKTNRNGTGNVNIYFCTHGITGCEGSSRDSSLKAVVWRFCLVIDYLLTLSDTDVYGYSALFYVIFFKCLKQVGDINNFWDCPCSSFILILIWFENVIHYKVSPEVERPTKVIYTNFFPHNFQKNSSLVMTLIYFSRQHCRVNINGQIFVIMFWKGFIDCYLIPAFLFMYGLCS